MKRAVIGILAHVDAGKTTLGEAMLYTAGMLRKRGRVDHGDSFLDTDEIERERGITIFAKQAVLSLPDAEITLLDTPGHVDFSAETERTMAVLDAAILVISGTDGVQGHTKTLFQLLERYHVPTFVFVNKMDLAGADRGAVLASLQKSFGAGCIDLAGDYAEAAALTDEAALEEYLESGAIQDKTLDRLIKNRCVFPCSFGSALKCEGVEAFLGVLSRHCPAVSGGEAFAAKVFKISRDPKGQRLTWMKITGGSLRAKAQLFDGEKADQLRIYSGAKFAPVEEAPCGAVVAVTGLVSTRAGQGLGEESDAPDAVLEPVLNYRLILPSAVDAHTLLPKLRQLEEEDPMLRILWNERYREIHVRLMGQVQLEVLKKRIESQFAVEVAFDAGSIVYKETIQNAVLGVGHFEPLRHYAEAHILIEPAPRGSGIAVASACPTDRLDLNWQRLILTHLVERAHAGVLTGSALTDVRFTLTAGKAHLKHTEGGDFRQATYRAVRQGLMQAESILLEPYYDFTVELPASAVGRAMHDLQRMGAEIETAGDGETAILTGRAPVRQLQNYAKELTAYTRGQGRLSCSYSGYFPCSDPSIIDSFSYDPDRDTENPSDSVFCAHGAGYSVPWNEVHEMMHVDDPFIKRRAVEEVPMPKKRERVSLDDELQTIFERTYGKTDRGAFRPMKPPARSRAEDALPVAEAGQEYLLVDGYNMLFAWDELRELSHRDIGAARAMLEEMLINYRAVSDRIVILVFDAYKVKKSAGSVEERGGIYIVYTKEAETADVYIERTSARLAPNYRVRVATSDNLEQMIIVGHGAFRLSAEGFQREMAEAKVKISALIEAYNRKNGTAFTVGDAIKAAEEE